jgi:hypothetical protein
MTTAAAQGFWLNPDFRPFRPYLRSSQDRRDRQHARIELDPKAPEEIVSRALSWTAPGAACEAPMHPFRARHAEAKRGNGIGNVYVGTTCPNQVNPGCSRSGAAAEALGALGLALTRPNVEPTQTSWLNTFAGTETQPTFRGLH